MGSRALFLVSLCGAAGAGGCGDDGGFPNDGGIPPIATGSVAVAWSITDLGGQPLTCDQVGASTVALTLHSLNRVYGVADSFSCGNSPSTSMSIESDVYDASFELHGANLVPVLGADQSQVTVTEGHTTQLAPVAFMVSATGNLVLQLAAPPLTTNCMPTGMMGAGINTDTITLQDAGGTCQPVTFVRSRGGATVGSYTVSCDAPASAPCIENDETLTATNVPSGPYTIHIRGQIGAASCWTNDDSLPVPAQGASLTRTLNLAFAAGTPGC
jgi:hypothetical protein